MAIVIETMTPSGVEQVSPNTTSPTRPRPVIETMTPSGVEQMYFNAFPTYKVK